MAVYTRGHVNRMIEAEVERKQKVHTILHACSKQYFLQDVSFIPFEGMHGN